MSSPSSLSSDEEDYSEDDPIRYAKLAGRIQFFTTAIWRTHLQPPAIPVHVPKRKRGWTWAYRNIATLLARDSRNGNTVVVTGGPLKDGRVSTISIVACKRVAEMSPSLQPCYHGSTCGDPKTGPRIRIETLQPSGADLRSLSDGTKTASDITAHAQDVLQALIHVANGNGDVDQPHLMCRFIIRRCRAAVAARVDAANHFLHFPYGYNIATVLRVWDCWRTDDLLLGRTSMQEEVLHPVLQQRLIQEGLSPFRDHDSPSNVAYFQFDWRTVVAWRNVFCSSLEQFLAAAHAYKTNATDTNLDAIAAEMILLSTLLSCRVVQYLLSMPSLNDHLMIYEKQPTGNGRVSSHLIGDERRSNEAPGSHVFRFLSTLAQWHTASKYLSKWLVRMGDQAPVCHLVSIEEPSANSSTRLQWTSPFKRTPPQHEALKLLTLNYPFYEEELQRLEAAVDGLFSKPPPLTMASAGSGRSSYEDFDYSGSVHSEALVMGLIKSAATYDPENTFSLSWPFHNSNRIIGLVPPHQCCYCCNFLFGALFNTSKYRDLLDTRNYDSEHLPFFSLPGLVVPWTPPPIGYGIPLEALEFLELEVQGLLMSILREYLEPTMIKLPSWEAWSGVTRYTAAPSRSRSPSPDEPGPMVEDMGVPMDF